MWKYYQPNPIKNDHAGDCAVRAVAKALGITWEQSYARLSLNGFLMCDMPSSDLVSGALLREAGFHREIVPNSCPDCYTVGDFAAERGLEWHNLFYELDEIGLDNATDWMDTQHLNQNGQAKFTRYMAEQGYVR